MASGAPDYTRKVQLLAKFGDKLVPVAVDANGQLRALISGAVDVSTLPPVQQADRSREIQGSDGTALRTIAVDAQGRIIGLFHGHDGVRYIPIRVDADGRIEALMKGEHAGTLKTLATDDQGRILATMTDLANIWGVQPVVGSAELAARLGSLSVYERRGLVFLQEDFSQGFGRFRPDVAGTGARATITADHWLTGGYALKLEAGTDEGGYARASHLAAPLSLDKNFGLEWAFSQDWYFDYIQALVSVHTGTRLKQFGVRYHLADLSLRVLHSPHGWVAFATGVDCHAKLSSFHRAKLVFAPATGRYLRLYWDDGVYDLSAYACWDSSSALDANVRISFLIQGGGPSNPTMVLDSVLFTLDEPAA